MRSPKWLGTSRREEMALDRVSTCLADFVIRVTEKAAADWPNAAVEFWNRIPDVRSAPAVYWTPIKSVEPIPPDVHL